MRRLAVAVSLFLAVMMALLLFVGFRLTQHTNSPVPHSGDLPLKRVVLNKPNGFFTVAWLLRNESRKAVILAHGNQSNRNSQLSKAAYFHRLGFTVLMPDLACHGESPCDTKTFGLHEAEDILASKTFLEDSTESKSIIAIGESLGGAAILRAVSLGADFERVIIECPFSTLATAISNRLVHRFGALGDWLSPLLTLQIPLWTGAVADSIQPMRWAEKCHAPILVLFGSEDWRATQHDARHIFIAAPSRMKRLHGFKGAGHQSFYTFNAKEYASIVEEFFGEEFKDRPL
jgi:uncharacterized protein